jgi:hypothetical protein
MTINGRWSRNCTHSRCSTSAWKIAYIRVWWRLKTNGLRTAGHSKRAGNSGWRARAIGLEVLRSRRQTITSELRQIEHKRQRLARSQQQMPGQQIIKHAERFRQLLGARLEALSVKER